MVGVGGPCPPAHLPRLASYPVLPDDGPVVTEKEHGAIGELKSQASPFHVRVVRNGPHILLPLSAQPTQIGHHFLQGTTSDPHLQVMIATGTSFFIALSTVHIYVYVYVYAYACVYVDVCDVYICDYYIRDS